MNNKIKSFLKSFTLFEIFLITIGITLVTTFSIVFGANPLAICSSVIGIIGVVFIAKGSVIGSVLGIIMSIFYIIVSYINGLYGEVVLYVLVIIPMNILSIIQWFKNVSQDKVTIKVQKTAKKDLIILAIATIIAIPIVYIILKFFNTQSLILSTFSIIISTVGTYLNVKRDKLTFIVFILHNLVVISLWIVTIINIQNLSLIPIIVNSSVNLFSNMYGVINWTKMQKKQNQKGSY
ncbi:MAG: nicotinamide mononucleotide transporter [Clostridiales bacterium]|nr:nicotinamide mononucleotide transporter [Clostridiales bacterium]